MAVYFHGMYTSSYLERLGLNIVRHASSENEGAAAGPSPAQGNASRNASGFRSALDEAFKSALTKFDSLEA